MSLANCVDPVTLVRSPTLVNKESGPMLNGSRPLRRQRTSISGTTRGGMPSTASTIASMCAGVVPQQPPTMLTNPLCAKSRITDAMCSGVSSYCPNSFGNPALG